MQRVLSLYLLAWPALGVAATDLPAERVVSLPELLSYAERHAPAVKVATARRGLGDAERAGASPWFRSNPILELGIGPRFDGPREGAYDYIASVEQPIEVSGARGLRLEAAGHHGSRLEAETEMARQEVRHEVMLTFRAAMIARQRMDLAAQLTGFADQMLDVARRRLEAGESTLIELRLAETEAARARQAGLAAEQDLRSSRLRLAEISGWPIEAPPQVPAALEPPSSKLPDLAEVQRASAARHPELRARHAAVAETHARAQVAAREAWPSPSLGVQFIREDDSVGPPNYILLGTVGLPLPIWQRNQGERARSRVEEEVARLEEDAVTRALSVRISSAYSALTSSRARLELILSQVSPSLEDSLSLLQRAFDAGELPLLTVALSREEFLKAQLAALDARADYDRALADLERAAGIELLPSTGGAP